MIEGLATLIIDIGNSSTKCCVIFGKDKDGKPKKREFELSNKFSSISPDYEVSADYKPTSSFILNTDVTLETGIQVVGNFCNGELQKKEKSLSVIKPSATEKKWRLPSTALSVSLAFYRAYRELLSITGTNDINNIGVTWNVFTLLPPGDKDAGKGRIETLIRSIKQVQMVFPANTVPVKINKVVVLPEGFCAYAAVVYGMGMTIHPKNAHLLKGTVLIVDSGAGTTDFLVIKDNIPVQNSFYTVTQGGNNVFQYVKRELRYEGLDLPAEEIEQGICDGFVKDGSATKDISDLINRSRSDIAQKIVSEFYDFLETTDTKMRSISDVLIGGGGAMVDATVTNVKALSSEVEANIKTLAPNCKAVEIPEYEFTFTNEDGSVEVQKMVIPLRWLNLVGAAVLSCAVKK